MILLFILISGSLPERIKPVHLKDLKPFAQKVVKLETQFFPGPIHLFIRFKRIDYLYKSLLSGVLALNPISSGDRSN